MPAVVCLKTKASEALQSNNGQQIIFWACFFLNKPLCVGILHRINIYSGRSTSVCRSLSELPTASSVISSVATAITLSTPFKPAYLTECTHISTKLHRIWNTVQGLSVSRAKGNMPYCCHIFPGLTTLIFTSQMDRKRIPLLFSITEQYFWTLLKWSQLKSFDTLINNSATLETK